MTYEEHFAAFERACINQGHGPEICPDCDARRAEVWDRTERARAEREALGRVSFAAAAYVVASVVANGRCSQGTAEGRRRASDALSCINGPR